MANMFEIIPIINAVKDGHQPEDILEDSTWVQLHDAFKLYIEDIFGLRSLIESNAMLNGVMDLLIEIRKESRANKNFATSDKIRNQLNALGIILKDEKDGGMSWGVQ